MLQGRVRENTGEVGNLLFDRWTADDLHELACLARDARDAKLEGFMRGEEVQPTGRITARIAGDQHAVDWDGIDPRLERRLSAVEKRYLAKRIGQNPGHGIATTRARSTVRRVLARMKLRRKRRGTRRGECEQTGDFG